ncbi:hypothetical protein HGRIS_004481 [Hohenbuehelia grisea]|uniref:Uncharacterized protein n=1 Tax=Hohenbuehelia grisea TaxID=104357 RepID=A0ABR3JCU3_9AGAR
MSKEEDSDQVVTTEPRRIENHLEPPIGTMFYKFERITIVRERPMHFVALPPFDGSRYNYTVTWEIDVYKYAVNGDPRDPNFASNNGRIYIIIVHRGSVRSGQNLNGMRFVFRVSTGLDATHQLPRSGSGHREGDDMHYEIDFRQTFHMLSNQGNDHISFEARYFENVPRIKSMQTSDIRGRAAIEFSVDPNTTAGLTAIPANSSFAVQGFSVFTYQDPSSWPRHFSFTHTIGGLQQGPFFPPFLTESRTILLDW